MADRYNTTIAEGIRILYGGSVKASNAAELLGRPNVDGALVEGASLKADEFLGIVAGTQADDMSRNDLRHPSFRVLASCGDGRACRLTRWRIIKNTINRFLKRESNEDGKRNCHDLVTGHCRVSDPLGADPAWRGGGLAGISVAWGARHFGTKAGDLFTRITIGVAFFWIVLCQHRSSC